MDKRAESHSDRDPRAHFGSYLRTHRDKSDLSLDEIARITKIPKHSLERLESGRFEELPGDVFVRGFLRSYARCVGLDGEEAVRAYARCGLQPAPVSSELADVVREGGVGTEVPPASRMDSDESAEDAEAATSRGPRILRDALDRTRRKVARTDCEGDGSGVVRRPVTAEGSGQVPVESAEAESAEIASPKTSRSRRQRTFLPPVLGDEEEASRRGPLTLAVIILVIVATLTMSYLLRSPGSSADGFTGSVPAGETRPS